ncbi:hypothetical protein TNCV_2222321 [Trichonephila clavipes]|nr:hypothetical protein TNCV_2222321 [Trichonephila clavipes]
MKTLPIKSCSMMVLHCRCRVWSRIVVQQQNAMSEQTVHFFQITSLMFDLGVALPRSIDGSNLQKLT